MLKHYWTCAYNCGEFYYWKAEDEKQLLKKASKLYCGKAFDHGETTSQTYEKGRKYE